MVGSHALSSCVIVQCTILECLFRYGVCDEFGIPVFTKDNMREDVVVNSSQWGLLPSGLHNKSWAFVVSRRAHCRHDATLNRHFASSISLQSFTQMDRH